MTCEHCDTRYDRIDWYGDQSYLLIDVNDDEQDLDYQRVRYWCPTLSCFEPMVSGDLITKRLPQLKEGTQYTPHVTAIIDKTSTPGDMDAKRAGYHGGMNVRELYAMDQTLSYVPGYWAGRFEGVVRIARYQDRRIYDIPDEVVLRIHRRTIHPAYPTGRRNRNWRPTIAVGGKPWETS